MAKKEFKTGVGDLLDNQVPIAGDDFELPGAPAINSILARTSQRTAPEPLLDTAPVEEKKPEPDKEKYKGELGGKTGANQAQVDAWEQAYQSGAKVSEADEYARTRTPLPGAQMPGPVPGNSMPAANPMFQQGGGQYDGQPGEGGTVDDPDRKARRQALAAKWSGKILNNLQAGLFVGGYDYLLGPDKATKERHRMLRDRALADKATEADRAAYRQLDDELTAFTERKVNYQQQATMPSTDEAELHECLRDIFSQEDVNISPAQVVAMVMGGQLLTNIMILMQHWFSYGKVKPA